MQHKKTFSIAKGHIDTTIDGKTFQKNELTFTTSSGKIKNIIGLSQGEKINQVHQRQRQYLENIDKIINLSHKLSDLDETEAKRVNIFIDRTNKANQEMLIEISKFKVGARLDGNDVITDYPKYVAYIKAYHESEVENNAYQSVEEQLTYEIMNRLLEEQPNFFTNFVREALKKSTTDSLIGLLRPILKDHYYSIVEEEFEEKSNSLI